MGNCLDYRLQFLRLQLDLARFQADRAPTMEARRFVEKHVADMEKTLEGLSAELKSGRLKPPQRSTKFA